MQRQMCIRDRIQTVQEQIVPALQALSDDPDADVRYYAQKALIAAQDM